MNTTHLSNCIESRWVERQREMGDWYKSLLTNPMHAAKCLSSDYEPFVPFLNNLTGKVLDIGGGIGIPRSYLPYGTKYVIVEPSMEWFENDWSPLAIIFPRLDEPPCVIQGVGEHLPLTSNSFDTVLCFWCLNHVYRPDSVLSEVSRVLRPGGSCLIVLEDMLPSWGDFFDPAFPAREVFNYFFDSKQVSLKCYPRAALLLQRIMCQDWPLQMDHIRIGEVNIRRWASKNFKVYHKKWVSQFMVFLLTKH